MKTSPPSSPNHQNLSIKLHFFRHDEKNQSGESPLHQGDYQVRLTEKGKQHAQQIGKEKGIDYNRAVGYHSPRERTQETLYHRLNLPGIQTNQPLEDINEKIGQHFSVGGKSHQDTRLDFYLGEEQKTETETAFKEAAYNHFDKGDYLVRIIDQSDEWFKKLNDKRISSYSKVAGDFAEMVQKYLNIFEKKREKADGGWKGPDEKMTNELQRLFASHVGTVEPFLLKVIEKLKGTSYLADFLKTYQLQNGFGYSESFEIEIKGTEDQKVKIVLKYKDKIFEISPEMLEEMIQERDTLYNNFLKNKK